MYKLLKIIVFMAALLALTAPGGRPAEARVFVGVGIGVPAYPAYYYPPPPVYYVPPPVYYAPPPPVVVYQPPAPVYAAPAPAPSNCRTYNGDATIDASGRPFYGTACLGADGRWHIQ